VTYVSWFAAKAYCERRGKRLPTTAEWERTAGKSAEAAPAAASRGRSPFRFAMGKAEAEARAVRGFGSIWEWTADFNSVLVSGRLGDSDGATGSAFCGDGVRATNPSDYGAFLRYSFRASLKADYTLKRLGFRCAKQPD
jgi:formylglycine-generating enzyme